MAVFLFTGDNKYKILKTIEKRKKAFIKKYGKANFHYILSEDVKTEQISNIIFSWWLFSTKKFIVIFWYPKDTDKSNKIPENEYKKLDKFLTENIKNIPEEDVLVFVSYQPDKRTKSYKFLKENIEVKEFKNPSEEEIKKFILSYLPNLNTTEINYIIEKLWTDLFKLEKELQKIKLLLTDWKIDIKKLIDEICFKDNSIDQFKLIDTLFTNPQKGLKLLDIYSKQWDSFGLLGLLLRSIKTSLLINDLYKKWYKISKQISEKLKIHPFVVSQRLKVIEKIQENEEKLKNLFKNLLNLEYKIKTWKIHSDLFWIELKNIINNHLNY